MMGIEDWLSCLAVVCGILATANGKIVNTANGQIEGTETVDYGVDVFWGIPFAKPPVDELRFKKPEPPDSWEGKRQATEKPNSCHQVLDTAFERFDGVEMWNANTEMSEDCLYLNVWAPKNANKLSVLVWIFGGGFWSGTSTLDVYDGEFLSHDSDVIVVTINYRVGPLGFLYLNAEDTSGNMGMFDQQAALKWIHTNIEAFGGDSSRITIFGESAGAVSVSMHLLSPTSWNYFANSAVLSGTALAWWAYQSKEKATSRTCKLAQHLNCDMTSHKTIFKCLQDASASNITNAQWNIIDYYFDPPFAPIIDGDFLPDVPEKLMKSGQFKNGSLISGVVKDEGTFWLLYGFPDFYNIDPTKNKKLSEGEALELIKGVLSPKDGLIVNMTYHEYSSSFPKPEARDVADDISGDVLFKCSVVDFAKIYAEAGNSVYMYSFEHRTSGNPWPAWMGVLHGYEIDHFFGFTDSRYTSSERTLSKSIRRYLKNMSVSGNPNRKSNGGADTTVQTWPEYNKETQKYMVLDTPSSVVKTGLRHRTCSYWENVVPQLQHLQNSGKNCNTSTNSSSTHIASGVVVFLMLILYIFH